MPPMMPGIVALPPQGSNMMSGLPPEIANKIVKDGQKTLSGLIQQHISEGYQALTQAGVPVADAASHIMGELLKLSPVAQGTQAGMNLMGGGSPPPGGPNPGGGGPPPGGMPAVKQDNQLNPGQLQNSPYQQGMPGFGNQPSSQTSQPQPGSQQPQQTGVYDGMPQMNGGGAMNVLGNLLNTLTGMPIAQTPQLLYGQDMARKAMYGQTPQGQLNMKKAEAEQVGLTSEQKANEEYRTKELSAGAATYQREAQKDTVASLDAAIKNQTDLIGQMKEYRNPWAKAIGHPDSIIEGIQQNIKALNSQRALAIEKQSGLAEKGSPNSAKSKYTKTGTYQGKKVGMTADGKLEFIK